MKCLGQTRRKFAPIVCHNNNGTLNDKKLGVKHLQMSWNRQKNNDNDFMVSLLIVLYMHIMQGYNSESRNLSSIGKQDSKLEFGISLTFKSLQKFWLCQIVSPTFNDVAYLKYPWHGCSCHKGEA